MNTSRYGSNQFNQPINQGGYVPPQQNPQEYWGPQGAAPMAPQYQQGGYVPPQQQVVYQQIPPQQVVYVQQPVQPQYQQGGYVPPQQQVVYPQQPVILNNGYYPPQRPQYMDMPGVSAQSVQNYRYGPQDNNLPSSTIDDWGYTGSSHYDEMEEPVVIERKPTHIDTRVEICPSDQQVTNSIGITYAAIRSALANRIIKRMKSHPEDKLAQTVYEFMSGPTQNFQSGGMDKLISFIALYADMEYVRGKGTPEKCFEDSVKTFYWVAWAAATDYKESLKQEPDYKDYIASKVQKWQIFGQAFVNQMHNMGLMGKDHVINKKETDRLVKEFNTKQHVVNTPRPVKDMDINDPDYWTSSVSHYKVKEKGRDDFPPIKNDTSNVFSGANTFKARQVTDWDVQHDDDYQGPVMQELNRDTVVTAFKQIKQEAIVEANKANEGLANDEVRILDKDESDKLFAKKGSDILEEPFTDLVSGDPKFVKIYRVLTNKGKIRQIISSIGEHMRLDTHEDILADMRRDQARHLDENEDKSTKAIVFGQTPYDRFNTSKVVLSESLAEITEDMTKEEKSKAINEAFDKFEQQVKEDEYDDKAGITEYIATHQPDEEVEGEEFTLPEFLDKDKNKDVLDKKVEAMSKYSDVQEIKLNENTLPESLQTNINCKLLAEDSPNLDNAILLATYSNTNILYVADHPREKVDISKAWDIFHRRPYREGDITHLPSVSYLAEVLRNTIDVVPVKLWSEFNNRATNIINKGLKEYINTGWYIDDFSQDWDDIREAILTEHNSLGLGKEESCYFVSYLEGFIRANLITLVRDMDIDELSNIDICATNGVNRCEARAIIETRNYYQVRYNKLAVSVGLKSSTVDTFGITETSSPDVYIHVMKAIEKFFKGNHGEGIAISDIYFSTSDDVVFKIRPSFCGRDGEEATKYMDFKLIKQYY